MIGWILAAALLAVLVLKPWVTGLRSQRLATFAGKGPAFDPRIHLNGAILCEGMIFGPFGRITSRFVAQMQGEWQGNRGVLREHFRYDDGTEQHREWRMTCGNDGRLLALADDIPGKALGQIAGPAVQMHYPLRLPDSAGGHVLQVVDWMVLLDNGSILNRSQFRKFGITVAELVATMRPVAA